MQYPSPSPSSTMEQKAVSYVFKNMCLDEISHFTLCYTKDMHTPAYLKVINPDDRRLFLLDSWAGENPYVQLLELMPYIIYIVKYFLYERDPGVYPTSSISLNSAMMLTLARYYGACIEYVLSKTTSIKILDKDLMSILTEYDKSYLDEYIAHMTKMRGTKVKD